MQTICKAESVKKGSICLDLLMLCFQKSLVYPAVTSSLNYLLKALDRLSVNITAMEYRKLLWSSHARNGLIRINSDVIGSVYIYPVGAVVESRVQLEYFYKGILVQGKETTRIAQAVADGLSKI